MTRLGRVERALLVRLERGPATTTELAVVVGRAPWHVRESLRALRRRGAVDQLGARRSHGRHGTDPALWRIRRRREDTRPNPERDEQVLAELGRLVVATVAVLAHTSGWSAASVRRALRELEVRGLVREAEGPTYDRWGRTPALWSVGP